MPKVARRRPERLAEKLCHIRRRPKLTQEELNYPGRPDCRSLSLFRQATLSFRKDTDFGEPVWRITRSQT